MQQQPIKIWKRRGTYYSLVCECKTEDAAAKKLGALQSAFPERDYVLATEQPRILSVTLH